MKKKLLMRLAAAALAVGMCLSSAGASYFTDVSPNAWYYDAVTECSDYGLLNGYQNGTFRPNATITRAECAALLDRMVDPDEHLVQRSAIKMYRKWIGIIWLLRAAVNY